MLYINVALLCNVENRLYMMRGNGEMNEANPMANRETNTNKKKLWRVFFEFHCMIMEPF
jgi:hypothetical protein